MFECDTQKYDCNNVCCKTETAGIMISLADIRRMSAYTKKRTDEFFLEQCFVCMYDETGHRPFVDIRLRADPCCTYLNTDGCMVHAVKPTTCLAAPFSITYLNPVVTDTVVWLPCMKKYRSCDRDSRLAHLLGDLGIEENNQTQTLLFGDKNVMNSLSELNPPKDMRINVKNEAVIVAVASRLQHLDSRSFRNYFRELNNRYSSIRREYSI
ncbi:MAG: hypothetical protein ABIA21_01910 [Candidatus Aenigmatarchaeota archaeon]